VVNKMLFGFASVAVMVASAASGYNVKFFDTVMINGAKLQPGEYRVEVNGNTAVIKHGKTVTEAPVKVENSDEKFQNNTVRLDGDRVSEIRLGGTHTRLVFEQAGGVSTK
jgi:hypothetical protein